MARRIAEFSKDDPHERAVAWERDPKGDELLYWASREVARTSPERRALLDLLATQIKDATAAHRCADKRLVRLRSFAPNKCPTCDAQGYIGFRGPGTGIGFSFDQLCEHLGMEPEPIRRTIAAKVAAKEKVTLLFRTHNGAGLAQPRPGVRGSYTRVRDR